MKMRERIAYLVASLLLAAGLPASASSIWGEDYFPNTVLTTQDGEDVRFFDDLIKDKIVSVNFIYTSCVDTCPLETAQLVRVQRIMGDRLGKDVFFYSISIDPEHDTPEVLKEYKERFGANWTFLTGDEEEIIELRQKLGLYIKETEGTLNHNVNMIIGNQTTGRWMKRSPFENPHVLADQLGNWLTGWKAAPAENRNYADAPELRSISNGENLFRTRCATCHTVTGDELDDALGPDLLGVTAQREMVWLLNWLRAPDQMLAAKDPIAMALFRQYNELPMPNMRLTQKDATDLIEYLAAETDRIANQQSKRSARAAAASAAGEDVVGIMNAWVRETDAAAKANAGYMTLLNVGDEDMTLVSIESEAFDKVEMHEMTTIDGMMKMQQMANLVIPANGMAKFAPGGQHLMLVGPKDHLRTGEAVDMTLVFDSGVEQTVSISVAAR